MKLFYLVQAHHLAEQFGTLVESLVHPNSHVVAHIDAKSDIALFAAAAPRETVFVPKDRRVIVKWAGWSQVEATLESARIALERAEPEDYLILLSGDSFPLRTQDFIHERLSVKAGDQYINGVLMPAPHKPLERISRVTLEYDRKDGRTHGLPRLINRLRLPQNYQRALAGRAPFGGTTWWAMTAGAMKWTLDELSRDPRIVTLSKRSLSPDEFIFQTLLFNSPFRGRIQSALMYTDWSKGGPNPAQVDSSHVRSLALPDFAARCGDPLFARKVTEPAVRQEIRDLLWDQQSNTE